MPELPRRLGVLSTAAVLIGLTIGSGIFRVPSTVAAESGSAGASLLLWVAGALIALSGALTFAELATLFPRSGGIFVFLREAYGPLPAFLYGWTELLVTRPAALGAIAYVFAAYTGAFFAASEPEVRALAALTVVALTAANYRSLSWAAAIENATTAAKLLALAALALALFASGRGDDGAFAQSLALDPASWGALGIALVAVLWAYDGWADTTAIAGEVRDPARALPRALFLGTFAVVIIYLAVNAAYFYVLPLTAVARSTQVAADAMSVVFGAGAAALVSALVMVSAFGALNGALMTGPRILYAMAADGLFFRPVARVHTRFETPHVAIMVTGLLAVLWVSNRGFEQLASAFVLGVWPFYVLCVLGVFLLRRSRPQLERPYRTWGYPIVPLVFLLASAGLIAAALLEQPGLTLFGFAVILSGVPVFYIWRRLTR